MTKLKDFYNQNGKVASDELDGTPGPIFNMDAEEAVIGSILISEDSLLIIADLGLTSRDFYIHRLGWIFEAAQDLHRAGSRVDLITVGDTLGEKRLASIGGSAYLTELSTIVPTHSHVRYYAEIVRRDSLRRQALNYATAVITLAHSEKRSAVMLAEIQAGVLNLLEALGDDAGATVAEIAPIAMDLFEQRTQMGGIVGLPTGLGDLDRILGGLKAGKMYTLAGRPGMGKSSLGTQIAWTAARDYNAHTLLFSLEMDRIEIFNRLWAYESDIPGQAIDNGTIPEDRWAGLFNDQKILSENDRLRIIDNATLSPDKIRQEAISYWAKNGLDLIVIDYLQLMVAGKKAENRQAEVAAISRAIKVLAGELNIPVIALAQLNRRVESRANKRPLLADLRDSGTIEQNSDAVIFLYRDSVYNPETEFQNLVEIIVAKHRGGPLGKVMTIFNDAIYKFIGV